MVGKIEKLTAAEERALEEYIAQRWAYGRSTEPADRETAEAQIEKMYSWLGKPRPYMVWVDGPWHGFLAQALLLPLILLGDKIDEVVDGSQLGSQLRSQLGSQLGSQLRSQLYSQLRSQLRSQLYSQLRSQLRSQLPGSLLWPWWCQFGSWWSYLDFPVRHIRRLKIAVELAEQCDAWVRLSQSLGHFWPFGRIAILSERMSECHIDDEGRLHHEDGPAMAYRDGTKVFCVHGVGVPSDVIEDPSSIGAERISAEENVEVRRVMMERYGHDRYLREAGAELVGEDEFGKLWRLDQQDDEPLVMVEVVNSTPEGRIVPLAPGVPIPDGAEPRYSSEDAPPTGYWLPELDASGAPVFKDYFLRVPPSMTTARDAVAWTFDVLADGYELAAQT